MLVLIGTDYISSCKSSYHAITIMMVPQIVKRKNLERAKTVEAVVFQPCRQNIYSNVYVPVYPLGTTRIIAMTSDDIET
jgi:hypothetical protein